MTDEQFANFLFYLLWDDLTDGNTPSDSDFSIIKQEFEKRGWTFDYY